MARTITIAAVIVTAGFFGYAVPLVRLFDAFQPIIVALSIMIAAVFVRLNRGMPTLEWKSINPDRRKILTLKIVELTKEYAWIIGIDALALIGLVTLSVVGKANVEQWSPWGQRITTATIGSIAMLCIARMAYVIWRDIDIVRLQKQVIDDLADRESINGQSDLADSKIASIRSANVRKVDIAPPKAWGE